MPKNPVGLFAALSTVLVGALHLACAAPASGGLGAAPAVVATPRPQVAIVGGGLAGLVAAHELERRGVSVHVLEAAERLGGRVRTVSYGHGLEAEAGMQELWEKSPLTALASALGLAFESDVAYSSVWMDGKLEPFVQETEEAFFAALFRPKELAALTAWMRRTEALYLRVHTGWGAEQAQLTALSFEEWLRGERLPPRVAEWIRLTIECELGARTTAFSALFGLLELRVFLFGGEKALHVEGGNSRLVAALADRLRGPVSLSARVTRIVREPGPRGHTARISYLQGDSLKTLEADRVLVTVPWHALHTLQLDPPLPAPVWRAIEELGRGQYVKVHLLVDEAVHALWGGADAHPFPVLTRGPLGVVYGIERPSPASQPLEVFTLLLYADAASIVEQPRERARLRLLSELDRLWPGFSSYVRDAHFYTYGPAAIPYWPKGRSPLDPASQRLFEPLDGLYLAGDYLVSSHSEGAAVAALRQAAAIADALERSEAPASRAGGRFRGPASAPRTAPPP